nr:MAG TPA: hypothetical protein [Caudoviricetes sp.]
MFKSGLKKQTESVVSEVTTRIKDLSGMLQIPLSFTIKSEVKASAYAKMDDTTNSALYEIIECAVQEGYKVSQVATNTTNIKGVTGNSTITMYTIILNKTYQVL